MGTSCPCRFGEAGGQAEGQAFGGSSGLFLARFRGSRDRHPVIPSVKFKPRMEERLLAGNLWVWRHELALEEKDYAPGSLVRLVTERGRPLAVGFVNTQSTIAAALCRFNPAVDSPR